MITISFFTLLGFKLIVMIFLRAKIDFLSARHLDYHHVGISVFSRRAIKKRLPMLIFFKHNS